MTALPRPLDPDQRALLCAIEVKAAHLEAEARALRDLAHAALNLDSGRADSGRADSGRTARLHVPDPDEADDEGLCAGRP